MTVANTARYAGPFTGTGVSVPYPFSFKVFRTSDLKVVQADASGVQSDLALSVDFTATLNADQNTSPGGVVSLITPLPVGYELTMTSDLDIAQTASLTNNGGFFPKVIEDALDKIVILLQEQDGLGFQQALRVPEIGGVAELPFAASRALRLLGFDSLGAPTLAAPSSGSAADLALILASYETTSQGAWVIGYTPGLGGSGENVGRYLDALNFDLTGTAPKIGIGGAADAFARASITSQTSRDGWASGVADGLQVNRTADTVSTSVNPLNHGIRVNSIITADCTAQVREWGVTSVAEDFSDGTSVTVGLTGIGRRHFGGSRTWGAQLIGVCYLTGAALAAATANVYGVEIDIEGDGDDVSTAAHRFGAYINALRSNTTLPHTGVVGDNRSYCGLQVSAQTADLWYGIRVVDVGPASVDEALYLNTVGTHAVHVGVGAVYSGALFLIDAVSCVDGFVMNADVGSTGAAFKMASTGNYGFLNTSFAAITTSGFQDSTTTAQNGFYAAGTYNTAAFRMTNGEKFMLGTDTTSGLNVTMRFNDSTRAVEFMLGGTVKSSVSII